MECHLYCSIENINKVFVDCNNNYIVQHYYMLGHMMLRDCNKMMTDDYTDMLVEDLDKQVEWDDDDNNKEVYRMMVLEDNNIELSLMNDRKVDNIWMDDEAVE
jgi:hypothetical protein